MMPQRKKRPKLGLRESSVIKSEGHKKWVRTCFACALSGHEGHECNGKNHAHHVKTVGAGGGDEQVVPLCPLAHEAVHKLGVDTFASRYGIKLDVMAANLWRTSPHRIKYEKEHRG